MKKKKFLTLWDYIIWIIILASAYGLYKTNVLRTEVGYFNDPSMITWNSLFYVLTFALLTGYFVAKLLEKVKR